MDNRPLVKTKYGQVELYYKVDDLNLETLQLAKRLEDCYVQRTPWKDFSAGVYENVQFPEETNSIDYVEYIIIDNTKQFIEWGQGNFVIGCKIEDLLVIDGKLEKYDSDINKIYLAVKPGGYMFYASCGNYAVYEVQEDGFIGHSVCTSSIRNSSTYHNVITAKVILDRQDTEIYEHRIACQEREAKKVVQI